MTTRNEPPEWIYALIDALAPQEFAEEIKGDLYELFLKDCSEQDVRRARRKFAIRGLGFLAKRFFWRKSQHNNLLMISSYFKMARRSLMAYKVNTVINVLGLVIGISAALVIFTVIHFEKSFDSFHSQANTTYRMVRVSGKNMDEFRTGISYPVPAALKAEIASLRNVVVMQYFGGGNIDVMNDSGGAEKMFREESGIGLTEQSFFDIFDFSGTGFQWLAGNPSKALTEPGSVVLTKTVAKKYFGDESALGRIVRFQKEFLCTVTGVVEDLPPNTDLPFTVFVSYSTVHKKDGREMNDWYSVSDNNHTYLVLEPGMTKLQMEKQIAAVHAAHTPKDLHESRHYLLQPLDELHNDARFGTYSRRTISNETILALSLIGVFLLLAASINYINLATAQSTMRAKEIGVRKVMGSNRKNIVAQFLTETFVIVLAAGIIALIVMEVLLFNLQSLLNMRWAGYHFSDPFVLGCLLIIIVSVTFFSGLYPSLVVSRFNPVTALKNKFSTGRFAIFSLRKVLVVFQFTITQVLVVGTFIVVSQMRFFNERDMGFNKEAIITARIPNNDISKMSVLANQLRSQPFVSGVSFSFTLPSGVDRNRNYADISKPGETSQENVVVFEFSAIDTSYLDLYEIPMLAGRNLNTNDSIGNILINRTLVKQLGLGTPTDALGQQLRMGRDVTVVGVIEDYYTNSLKYGVDPMVMTMQPDAYQVLSVKLNMGDGSYQFADATAAIEKFWKAAYPEYVFNYQFLDENIKAFYVQEEKYAKLFQLFSLVFLLIGCLGLYGLITFVVNRKGKEVAIRKVLGATISQILMMFSREYVQLILLSFLLAVPVTWYAVNLWLNNFAERIPLHWWTFLIPGIAVLVIALLVVTIKSLRTANANPVDKLKCE